MDRPIPKKTWTAARLFAFVSAVGLISLLTYLVAAGSNGSRLQVDPSRIAVSRVSEGEFQEYIPITGVVTPHTTVYLDLEEGGIVETIYLQGGEQVKKGDLILSFSNSTAQKANIDSETRLLDNLNQLRTAKINLTQQKLSLQDQLLDQSYRILELEKTFKRYQQLMDSTQTGISKEQYELVRDELDYRRKKRDLLTERIRQETVLQEQQSHQIEESIGRVNRSLEILGRIMDSLTVRAPIDGYLSSMNAEIGQNFVRGQRIGQIDQLDSFKVRAEIDQYYISRVAVGQNGNFNLGGNDYQLAVSKIYPEVVNDSFQVDFEFVGNMAGGIKRGQTLQIDLSLGESKKTRTAKKGGFYRHTNGRWVYKVADDGLSANRVSITAGRQNPQSFEILDGLEVGDTIITSGYDIFNGVDVLTFSEPIKK